MSLGIVHFMAFPEVMKGTGPIIETAQTIINDPFFGVLEVTHIEEDRVRDELAALCRSAHMDIGFGAQPQILMHKLNLNSLDEAERGTAIARMKECVDEAYALGARIMALMSGPDPGEERRAEATAAFVDSVKQVCRYAEDKSTAYTLTISVENFDRTIDKKSLIGPTEEAVAVIEAVKQDYPNVGLLEDLSHLPLLGETAPEALPTAADYLVQIHVGNCLMRDASHAAYGDAHPRFGIEGGENDVEELRQFLETLVYVGYFEKALPTQLPVVSFEIKPLAGESSAAIIAGAKRVFERAWAQV